MDVGLRSMRANRPSAIATSLRCSVPHRATFFTRISSATSVPPFGCIDRYNPSTISDDVQRASTASIQFTRFDACCTLPCRVASNVLHSERIVMSVAPISSIMRLLLVSFGTLSLLFTTPQAQAQDKVLRVGTLKLIHGITPYFYEKFAPPGYTVEVIPFESPTDGKNAVLTGTVDTCIHGIAAFLLGAAAGEPVVIVAAATNRGMGIVADAKSDIKTIKDLKGKRVAIFPGSTQEVVILERLKAEGMSISDIQPIRLSFSDMAAALARGDIDAYVGAEPGPGISLANGTGRLIEYPS